MNTLTQYKFTSVRKKSFPLRSDYIILSLSCLLSVCLILRPYISASAVQSAVSGCVTKLIPSLFPFICLSGILTSLGFGKICGRIIGAPFSALTGLNKFGASAFVLGAVCGFPIGGKTAIALGKKYDFSEKEILSLSALCNNAGAGFVICGIGYGIWGDIKFGALLFTVNLLSAYAVLIITTPFFEQSKATKKPLSIYPENKISDKTVSIMSVISNSVADGAASMLKICGFVVFFTVIASAVGEALSFIPQSDLIQSAVSAFMEITTGVSSAQALFSSGKASELFCKSLTFFSVGFGGLSGIMQLIPFSDNSIDGKKLLLLKLIQGVFCTITGCALLLLKI